jgi:hypothetical protein
MFHLSTEELCVISVLLEEEENIQNSEKRKRKHIPVHKMLNKRKTEGEYWTLYKQLMDDEEKFLFPFLGYRYIVHLVNYTKMDTHVLILSTIRCP